jgi:hypothetical protein
LTRSVLEAFSLMQRDIVQRPGFVGREKFSPPSFRAGLESRDTPWMRGFREAFGNSGDFSASARVGSLKAAKGLSGAGEGCRQKDVGSG